MRLRRYTSLPFGVLASLAVMWASANSVAAQEICSKDDFAAVVDQSSKLLTTLNEQNKAPFQAKLRALKSQKGWSDQQFLVEARPYVIDDRIQQFDEEAAELVQAINTLGDTSGATAPDCKTLDDLKTQLDKLVAITTAKWTYMSEKIDTALK